ncbi:hypothetical protein KIN20_018864 [Parelaphostrongylus tenuis]|uniref:Uncharacterized protein n=1 Tax=Parelaphostrongylus tenuis TaxID=148309 RepID=A0AAD5QSI0_PARTN|nr:hypothetical protein KIN20_018864 [Parelaphostrongylus tenuis]
MRRDTITRRKRVSHCDLCELEAKNNSPEFGEFRKAVTRHRRNAKLSSKAVTIQNNMVQPSNPSGPQSASAHNFFIPSNDAFARSVPPFFSPNVHYSTQNPMVMSCATDQTVFSEINAGRNPSEAEVNNQLCFTRQSCNTSLGPDVFGCHVPSTPLNANVNVMKHDAVKEKICMIDHNTDDRQTETCPYLIEYPVQQAYDIRNDGNSRNSFLNCSSSNKSSFEVKLGNVTGCGSDLTETFGLYQGGSHGEHSETTSVVRSL